MTDYNLLRVCLPDIGLLDDKKQEFVRDVSKAQARTRSTSFFLSDRQHQYLQACYDQIVSRKYGVEPMSTDREFAARRAIAKARDPRLGK